MIETYIRHYETEFGLEIAPRAVVYHTKHGRRHAHVVWSLVREDGSVVSLAHDRPRREKVSRIVEFEHGLSFTRGKHNRSAAKALRAEGRGDVADAMELAGLLDGGRPVAHSTPRQRAQAERTAVPIDEIRADALAAWQSSSDAASFAIALHAFGSAVATGEKGLVLIDRSGSVHSLNRTLAAAARAAGEDKITAAAVRRRLAGISFPTVEEIRNARSNRRNLEAGDRRPADIGAPVATLGPPERRARSDVSDRRIERSSPGDFGNSRSPSERASAHRARVRDRAAALALKNIDLQAINKSAGDVMKSIKAQNFKAEILARIAPEGFHAHAFAIDLRLIKTPAPGNSAARILTNDGGWIEYDSVRRSVRTWGQIGRAQVLAQALADAIGVEVSHLAKTASVGAEAAPLSVARASEDMIQSLTRWWAMRGYSATAAPDGCWINVGHARIRDTGDRMEIYGGLTDEAIDATMIKAKETWDGGVYLDGEWTQAEKDRMWIAAQRAGIEIQNCTPTSSIENAWRREQEAAAAKTKTISAVRTEVIEAQHLLEAAKGDVDSAKKLPGNLQAFIAIFLDDDQRRELAAHPVAEIVPHLARFRKLGQTELDSYVAPVGQKVTFAEPEQDKPRIDKSGPSGVHTPQ